MKKNKLIKYICLTLAFVFCFLFTSTANVVNAFTYDKTKLGQWQMLLCPMNVDVFEEDLGTLYNQEMIFSEPFDDSQFIQYMFEEDVYTDMVRFPLSGIPTQRDKSLYDMSKFRMGMTATDIGGSYHSFYGQYKSSDGYVYFDTNGVGGLLDDSTINFSCDFYLMDTSDDTDDGTTDNDQTQDDNTSSDDTTSSSGSNINFGIFDTPNYSSVVADLKSSGNFNTGKYPFKETDYKIEVIGISESKDYELFVYVYVPSADKKGIKATSINISTKHKDLDFDNHFLTLISSNGVFHKYKVNDFKVKFDTTRYYEISSIFRKYNSALGDTTSSSTNTTSEVGFAVGKSYKHTDNFSGGYDVYIEDIDLIAITDRYVGFMRYPDGGFFTLTDAVDVHFIAFSTDFKMDQLLDADLIYTATPVTITSTVVDKPSFGTPLVGEEVTVDFRENMTYDGTGWLSPSYAWKSIEKASDFLLSESKGQQYNLGIFDATTTIELKAGAKADIESKDWVIRFAITDYRYQENGAGTHSTTEYTAISDVSILRLAFKTDGVYYNMGVVDNKTSATPNEPSNDTSKTKTVLELEEDIMNIIKIILLLIAIAILLPFLTPVVNILWTVAKFIINVVLWVVTLPFKLIATLFKK